MKLLSSFFKLIRWPNLVFIIITQVLFYFFIIIPFLPASYNDLSYQLTQELFWLLVLASVLIAAAGYIINDYFDINIDMVNKPDKIVLEKHISRRWAMLLHWGLTTVGIALSLYVGIKTTWLVFFANIICSVLLWLYSTTFKRKLLSGNIIISLLTAWTIVVIFVALNTLNKNHVDLSSALNASMLKIYKFTALYAGFAFIISLIREVVKDIEDMEGDDKYECKTMPIVWGVPVAKMFSGVWISVLIGALVVLQVYVIQFGAYISVVYCVVLIIAPLIWTIRKLYAAQQTAEYHLISKMIKLIMLTGILSMIFVKFYF